MEDIAYHESFVRNSVMFAFKEYNNMMKDCQGLLFDPRSDPSVSKVTQQTYVGLQLYCEGKFYSSHLE